MWDVKLLVAISGAAQHNYPDHLTQGHDLTELEEMLADVYQIRQENELVSKAIIK
jgi:hypothetical protein